MNTSSAEAGFELCKEVGVITEWHIDISNNGYNLIKKYWNKNKTRADIVKGFLSMKVIQGISSPVDLNNAVVDIFNSQDRVIKQSHAETMIEGKLEKLLKRMENNITIDKGIIAAEMGWVKIRLDTVRSGRIMKKDIIKSNEMWKKYK